MGIIHVIVLLLGISPAWGFADEVIGAQNNYGPITSNDTLAEIAINLKGDGPWHYQRWMYALYQKNQQAFFGNNMNNLKLGALLAVPTEEELAQVNKDDAFRAMRVHLYVLQQQRLENRESDDVQGGTKFAVAMEGESDEELLTRARMRRLLVSNELMQQESNELFEKLSLLEQQMGSVIDQVLESEEGAVQVAAQNDEPEAEASYVTDFQGDDKGESNWGWWFTLLSVALIYSVGFIWRKRVEAAL
ncbi:MAG: hypothetical protein GQ470_05630 [Gammaproteobacteria bacterium]|nr:hypothetical protein [Gammaproteobacteria bacterium]